MPVGRENLSAGRSTSCCGEEHTNLREIVIEKGREGYDFVIMCISHPRCCVDIRELSAKARELSDDAGAYISKSVIDQVLPTKSVPDIVLPSQDWSNLMVGKISPWIDPDSADPYIRRLSEVALKDELAYFAYLSLSAVLIPLRGPDQPNLARIISDTLSKTPPASFLIWVDVPITAPQSTDDGGPAAGSSSGAAGPSQNGHSSMMMNGYLQNGGGSGGSSDTSSLLEIEEGESAPPTTPENETTTTAAGSGTVVQTAASGNSQTTRDDDEDAKTNSTWRWFYNFRRACGNHRKIQVVLELTADLPEAPFGHSGGAGRGGGGGIVGRWKGEHLAAVKFDTRTFTNSGGGGGRLSSTPTLPAMHERVTKELFKMDIQCLVDGPTLHVRRHSQPAVQQGRGQGQGQGQGRPSTSGSTTAGGAAGDGGGGEEATSSPQPPQQQQQARYCLYYAYLNSLWKNRPAARRLADWAPGYDDHLQAPLQPLSDHLESEVYETFERDPAKYERYRDAVQAAMQQILGADNNRDPESLLVVMVLGAGRGPLVKVCYDELMKPNVNKFKLYAIEKNPCAIITLNHRNAKEWNNQVQVIFSDMRNFHPPQKADIVVSELLGSFGDNELSPECLDGASHLMKPYCISIPASYRSYIAPIHSPKLFTEIRDIAERDHKPTTIYESPYVVRIFNHFEIAKPKLLFRFDHPNFDQRSNDRYQEVSFVASESSEMMGLVGYFYSTLFCGTSLSTVPGYETPGLYSWFPILFSLKWPVYVKKGERIRVRFWRCSNVRQVWYEWQLVEPMTSPIMNTGGRSYAMKLV